MLIKGELKILHLCSRTLRLLKILLVSGLVLAVFFINTSESLAESKPPVIFFSDLTWGPRAGFDGSTTKGAAVSIWGKNFGTLAGNTVSLSCGGVTLTNTDTDYIVEWGVKGTGRAIARDLEQITFFLKNDMSLDAHQNIGVTVDGKPSNTIAFDVIDSSECPIYFINRDIGSNTIDTDNPDRGKSLSDPFKSLYMLDPARGLGDNQYIIYAKAASEPYSDIDQDGALIIIKEHMGAPDKRKALIGYPGELPEVSQAGTIRGFIAGTRDKSYGLRHYITVSKFKVDGTGAIEVGSVGTWGDHNRIVGLWFKDFTPPSQSRTGTVFVGNGEYVYVYGCIFDNIGFDSFAHGIYVKTKDPVLSGDVEKVVNHVYIGYNEFKDYISGDHDRGGMIFVSADAEVIDEEVRNVHIFGNYFSNIEGESIYIGDSTGNKISPIYIYNNIFDISPDEGSSAIRLFDGVTEGYITNNTFYKPCPVNSPIIYINDKIHILDVSIKNNIFYGRRGQVFIEMEAWKLENADSVTNLENNAFYDEDSTTVLPSGSRMIVSTTNQILSGNPFLDPDNHVFMLNDFEGRGAMCIDNGVMESNGENLDIDYLGLSRPQGSAIDIGAFEFISGKKISAPTNLKVE